MIERAGDAIAKALAEFDGKPAEEVRRARQDKYLAIGRGV